MERFSEKFEREVEQGLDSLAHELGIWFRGGRAQMLQKTFEKQKVELPPPDILKRMLEIDYPNFAKLCQVLAIIWGPVPKPRGPFFRPIHSLVPLKKVMGDVIDRLKLEPTDAERRSHIYLKVIDNLRILSRDHPNSDGSPRLGDLKDVPDEQLITPFFKGTPFFELLHMGVRWEFPMDQRAVHTTFTAASQSGKTYLMKAQVLADRLRDDPYPGIFLDPKDDVWNPAKGTGAGWEHLARDKRITNKVLITPEDVLGMNPFDVIGNLQHIKDGYSYFFSSIMGQDFTAPMETMLGHMVTLCLRIPGATLDTMRDVLLEPEKFREHIGQLPDVDREYFQTEFIGGKGKSALGPTKEAMRQRLNAMRAGPLGAMFRTQDNKINMRKFIDDGALVIIHASPNILGKMAVPFGRWFVAEAVRAARSRRSSRQCFFYCDEASLFFDRQTETILEYMATSHFAGFFAFQTWAQARRAGVDSAMGNARVKIFGGHDDDDLAHFREVFYPERRGRLHPMPAGKFYARIAGRAAFTFEVPRLEPDFMSEEEYKAFRDENRQRLFSPVVARSTTPPPSVPGRAPQTDDQDLC